MKILGIALILLGGALGLGAVSVVMKTPPSVGAVFGAFVVPVLVVWWGVIALGRANKATNAFSPATHLRCPDCRELILKDAKVCKHCGCRLVPQS